MITAEECCGRSFICLPHRYGDGETEAHGKRPEHCFILDLHFWLYVTVMMGGENVIRPASVCPD